MNDKITIILKKDWPASVLATASYPNGLLVRDLQLGRVYNANLWHYPAGTLPDKAAAWMRAANLHFIHNYHIRTLRNKGEISFPAPNRKCFFRQWKAIHLNRNGMWHPHVKPNLTNV